MERKSCCSARSCYPLTRTVITPKHEPQVIMKLPKVEDIKLEPLKKAEGDVPNPVKIEDQKPGITLTVKREEDAKVKVDCCKGDSGN